LSTNNMVAIKEMQLSRTNMAINKVMMREVRILNEIGEHPNIVKVKECFKYKGSICLVLEYLPMDLITFYKAVREKERRGLNDAEITYIFRQICSAIKFMHAKEMIHRDIKPENILIDPTNLKVKLIDFGFAKVMKNEENTQYMVTRWYRPL
jgi:serine/threonine protein kinase